jgi:ankyrin repeat protein
MNKYILTLSLLCGMASGAAAEDGQLLLDRQLIKAVQHEDVELVKNLLRTGANPNNPNVPDEESACKPQNLRPAIHQAVLHKKSLIALIETGIVDLNLLSNTHYCDGGAIIHTPLVEAMGGNDDSKVELFEYLIGHGADINFIYEYAGERRSVLTVILRNFKFYGALHRTVYPRIAENNVLLGLEFLTDSFQYDPEYVDKLNWLLGRAEELRILPNIQGSRGSFVASLLAFCDLRSISLIKRTISLGAVPSYGGGDPISAILSCAAEEMNMQKLQLLSDFKIGFSQKHLQAVLVKKQFKLAEQLQNIEPLQPSDLQPFLMADYNYREEDTPKPFIGVADASAIKFLSIIGADVKSPFGTYFPNSVFSVYDLLSYLIRYSESSGDSDYERSSVLLQFGASANRRVDKSPFETPLMLAAKKQSEGFVRALREGGADFDARDEAGSSVLNYFIDEIYDDRKIPSQDFFRSMLFYSKNSINSNGLRYCINSHGAQDRCKWTPLHQLAVNSSLDEDYVASMISFAIHCGANANLVDQFDRTPSDLLFVVQRSDSARLKISTALNTIASVSSCGL